VNSFAVVLQYSVEGLYTVRVLCPVHNTVDVADAGSRAVEFGDHGEWKYMQRATLVKRSKVTMRGRSGNLGLASPLFPFTHSRFPAQSQTDLASADFLR
jgi:hypothetical protein